MGDEDYAKHILQKFRLVISLAVIKTKPENMTLAEHIQKLKNLVSGNVLELDNLTICSDDFLLDDIDDFAVNIDKNFDNDGNDDLFTQLSEKIEHDAENMKAINETRNSNVNVDANENETRIPLPIIENNHNIDYLNETNVAEIFDAQDLNASVTILDNFDIGNEKEDTITVTKEESNLNDIIMEMNTPCKIPSKCNQDNRLTQLNRETHCTDIDATQCDFLDETADEHIFLSQKYKYDSNYIKQTRQETIVGSHIINIKNKKQETTDSNKLTEEHAEAVKGLEESNDKNVCINNDVTSHSSTSNMETKWGSNSKKKKSLNRRLNTADSKKSDLNAKRHTKEFKNIYKNVADIFGTKKNDGDSKVFRTKRSVKTKNLVSSQDELNCSQDVPKYTTQDFTCETYYSESQTDGHITIDDKYIHGIKRNINVATPNCNKKKKKESTNTNDITNDEDIFLPEIQLESVLAIEKINKMKKPIVVTHAKTEVSEIILQDSQKTSYTTQNDSNEMFTKIDEYPLEVLQDLITIHNPSYENSKKDNVDESKIHVNDVNLNENDRAYNCNNLLNAKDIKQNNNVILPNAIKINNDNPNEIVNDNQLNSINTLRADIQNITDKNQLNAEISQNPKNIDIEDELFKQSQLTMPCSSGTFQNYISDKNSLELRFSQKDTDFGTKKLNITNKYTASENNLYDNYKFKTTDFDNSQNTQSQMQNSEHSRNFENINMNEKTCNVDNISNEIDEISSPNICTDYNSADEELTDLGAEKVPFKIIEEMTKVKIYLHRRQERQTNSTGYSSDAGYRSDSCSKNSILSQSSNSILDQSAHSLLNYISGCTLTAATEEITEEISLVLGQLTDRLNEEEKYPTFLENMLQEIQRILGQIYENNSEGNMLVKEESVHRIILLNKSIHVQKYTIDKITDILEKIHTKITNKESFETQNIKEIENICYIFNLLETILHEYKKSQNFVQKIQNFSQEIQFSLAAQSLSQGYQNVSQGLQLSQGCHNLSQRTQSQNNQVDKLLKKSNIMDIWRKKWNPNNEGIQNEGNEKKKCVLSHCNTVLNKLIVDCMESYSLISYFALKCFNIMQN